MQVAGAAYTKYWRLCTTRLFIFYLLCFCILFLFLMHVIRCDDIDDGSHTYRIYSSNAMKLLLPFSQYNISISCSQHEITDYEWFPWSQTIDVHQETRRTSYLFKIHYQWLNMTEEYKLHGPLNRASQIDFIYIILFFFACLCF
jgi:hypothetical protein